MIGFMSVTGMVTEIKNGINKVPRDIDLVVGIPRSGMIPAYLIGLYRNVPVIDLPSFVAGQKPEVGQTRNAGLHMLDMHSAKSVLLVDDSVCSGQSIERALHRFRSAGFAERVTTCAVIVEPLQLSRVDVYFREMPCPRIFEWNAFHHPDVIRCACVDLDGVLCVDPRPEENDDGLSYRRFIETATVRFRPTNKIGHIVSARLEKYRTATEGWLARNHIEYGTLHLIDLPSAVERRRLSVHARHKAAVYVQTGAHMFFESDNTQSKDIATLSKKPVLCTDTMQMHLPGIHTWPLRRILKWKFAGPVGRVRRLIAS